MANIEDQVSDLIDTICNGLSFEARQAKIKEYIAYIKFGGSFEDLIPNSFSYDTLRSIIISVFNTLQSVQDKMEDLIEEYTSGFEFPCDSKIQDVIEAERKIQTGELEIDQISENLSEEEINQKVKQLQSIIDGFDVGSVNEKVLEQKFNNLFSNVEVGVQTKKKKLYKVLNSMNITDDLSGFLNKVSNEGINLKNTDKININPDKEWSRESIPDPTISDISAKKYTIKLKEELSNNRYERHIPNESDFNKLARGEEEGTLLDIKKEKLESDLTSGRIPVAFEDVENWNEPYPFYNAVYPDNKVMQSQGGIVFETDDTPKNKRIHMYHPANTYVEINDQGLMNMRIANNYVSIIDKNQYKYIKQDLIETIVNDVWRLVQNDTFQEIQGNEVKDTHGSVARLIEDTLHKLVGEYILTVKSSKSENVSSDNNFISGSNTNVDASTIYLNSGTSIDLEDSSPTGWIGSYDKTITELDQKWQSDYINVTGINEMEADYLNVTGIG